MIDIFNCATYELGELALPYSEAAQNFIERMSPYINKKIFQEDRKEVLATANILDHDTFITWPQLVGIMRHLGYPEERGFDEIDGVEQSAIREKREFYTFRKKEN